MSVSQHCPDPGLQPERTTLAWVRTAASLAGVALLFLRHGLESNAAHAVVGLAGLGFAVVVIARSARRHDRAVASFSAGRTVPLLRHGAALTGLTVAMALTTGITVIWGG
ncbi:DUF202 domain-containing protein [Nocardia speluncae]|uniref:DUF202 domain-containing protein n=1 Tax=Nocardia speluncae TaxID=419477 RepID=A0A846XB07_9NOCA|nr:DUF202 domain-containing protein [Nocardia speluncae]NKY33208.1 DUF202 domain-containing protein [Nocardia speluncae]